MAGPVDIIEEYLVSLGFKVNNTQLNSMLKGLDTAKNQTASFAGKMTKNLASGGVALISFIATATVATGKFLESMANADMETEKLSRHLWITEESTRSLQNALSAMGEDLGSLNDIAMNPELRGQFTELYNLSKQLRGPQELQDQLKFIRSITFEFKKMKLIASYTMQNVAFYLTKYLGKNLENIKQKLQYLNAFVIKNMPKIASVIAKGLYSVIRLGETLVITIYEIIKGLKWLFESLPAEGKLAFTALAAVGFMALNPFTLFIGALALVLLLLEDYYSFTQGKKTLLGGMWGNLDTMGAKFGGVATEFDDMVKTLTGASTIDNTFQMWSDAASAIYEAFQGINQELKAFKEFFDKDSKGLEWLGDAGSGAKKIIHGSQPLTNPMGWMSNWLADKVTSNMYSPYATTGNSTSKTNNVNVNVKQSITSTDPTMAGKESAKYIDQAITRSLNTGVAQ